MTREQRETEAAVLEDFCETHGLEHTTACYEQDSGSSFWVCPADCPTLLGRSKKWRSYLTKQLDSL